MNKKPEFFNLVQKDINDVEAIMRVQADGHHKEIQEALKLLLSSGGKRIRPIITILIGRMLNAPREQLITMAASIEMLHTATLVHDDLIDESILRRGMPTLNAQWSPGATVLTGDFLFSKAASLAAATESIPSIKLFSETLGEIVNGEITQLFISRCNPNRENYYNRIYAKTASLFRTSACTAAMISTASQETVQKMSDYGKQVGMAFQIIDDILDFTGEQVTVGKPVGSDLRHGLVTLPSLVHIENNPEDPKVKFLLEKDCDRIFDDELIENLIKDIKNSNSIRIAFDEAKEFVQNGIDFLGTQPDCEEKFALIELANFIIDRNI